MAEGPRRSATPPTRRKRRPTAGDRPGRPSPRVRRRRALLGATLALFVVVALLFAFGYPIRTLLDQRSQIGAAHRHLDGLQRATAALDRQSRQLTGDAEVERIARERYGLVRPGETPYVLVPVAPTTTVPTTVPPTSPPTTRP